MSGDVPLKKLLALALLCASMPLAALELEGARLEESMRLEQAPLLLNGAGVRSMVFFNMYAIGLYLSEKQQSAGAIMADGKPKRIALHVLVGEAGTERFLNGFRKGIEKNRSASELAALRERMDRFDLLFGQIKNVKRGDVIAFDWLPGAETRVTLNGAELGRIDGGDFYRALLSIWIGSKPVSDDLKKELLGG